MSEDKSDAQRAVEFSLAACRRLSALFARHEVKKNMTGVPGSVLDRLALKTTFSILASPIDHLSFSSKAAAEKYAKRLISMADSFSNTVLKYKRPDIPETELLEKVLPLELLDKGVVDYVAKAGADHFLYLCRAGLALKEQREKQKNAPKPPDHGPF